MTATLHGIAPLPHLGVIAAEGDDAATFLQSQLTNDFGLLPDGQARLAAFCNAKGRMQASFIAARIEGGFALVTSADLLARTLKRLSMFVLRAKVRLSDAGGRFELRGLVGDAVARACGGAAPPPWTQVSASGGSCIGLYPAGGQPRALWIAPAGAAAPAAGSLTPEQWQWTEVRAGVATVSEPIFEAFVPQMLNYESVGGVNFKKGCYPGQEVVARSQFRGTLKRRAYVAHADAPMAAGMELFHESDAAQPCGLVAQAAPAPQGGCEAIVSLQVTAADGGRITLGSAQGAPLRVLALPYELLADV